MRPIPPAQALLILIDDQLRKEPELRDEALLKRLKMFHLFGPNSPGEHKEILSIIEEQASENGLLAKYEISIKPSVISADASRRYFESTLAFETLKQSLHKISLADLEEQYTFVRQLVSKKIRDSIDLLYKLHWFPENEMHRAVIDSMIRIRASKFYLFSKYSAQEAKEKEMKNKKEQSIDRKKLEMFVKIAYSSVRITTQFDEEKIRYPIDIYLKGLYSREERGREYKNQTIQAHALGIMRSTMPLSPLDNLFSDKLSMGPRVADSYHCIEDHNWPKYNFEKLVHPFSASISGSILTLLQVFAYLAEQNSSHAKLLFNTKEKIREFLRCFISFFVYEMGTHTLFEFISVLRLPPVQEFYNKIIPGFKDIDMASLFYEDNQVAYEKALAAAIKYNQFILQRMHIHDELIRKVRSKKESKRSDEKKYDVANHKNDSPISFTEEKLDFAILKLIKMAVEVTQEKKENIRFWQTQISAKSPVIVVSKSVKFSVPRCVANLKKIYDPLFQKRSDEPDDLLVNKIMNKFKRHVNNYLKKMVESDSAPNSTDYFYLGIKAILDDFQNINRTKKQPNKLEAIVNLGQEYHSKYFERSRSGSRFKL